MNYLTAAFSAAHWLGVAAYTGSFVFLILVFQKTYRRYRSYKYIDNFRAEAIALYWKILHIAFLVIIVSGAALAGLGGKSVLKGLYGLIFSTKLALWLAQIYLAPVSYTHLASMQLLRMHSAPVKQALRNFGTANSCFF